MNDLAVTDIQCHMAGVTDQVTCLCIGKSVNRGTLAAVSRRGMRQTYTEVSIYTHTNPEQSVPLVRLDPPYT